MICKNCKPVYSREATSAYDMSVELCPVHSLTERLASVLRLYNVTHPDHAAMLLLKEYDTVQNSLKTSGEESK